MKFYELDNALQEAIAAADKPVRARIEIDFAGDGSFEGVFEQDIVEADFYGMKEAAGGTSARGEVLLNNPQGIYSRAGAGPGTQAKVSFSLGEGLPWFERFILYIDDKGAQDIQGPGRKRFVRLGLRDLSYKLRRTDEARDWKNPAVFACSVVCDKTRPEKSLAHGIAQRAGLGVGDIDCSTIPVTLPYARLTKNIWAELSELATAYRCHLECAPEKPLVFAHSPYQTEPLLEDDYSCTHSVSYPNGHYNKTTQFDAGHRGGALMASWASIAGAVSYEVRYASRSASAVPGIADAVIVQQTPTVLL